MFNLELFDIKLDTDFIGRNFIYSDEVESTNSVLMDRQNRYNTNGTVLLAEKQNAGRGRLDRSWHSAKGQNLTFSVLLNDKKLLSSKIIHINFAAALSTGYVIESRFRIKTEMKWPNDVLVGGRKIAGILLESSYKGDQIERLVVGIGININQTAFQGNFKLPPTSIFMETSEMAEREAFLAEFLNTFEENLYRVVKIPDEILKEWRNKCNMIGERIMIEENDKIRSGIFDDIDNNGYLLLRNGSRIETIHFGDVTLK